MTPRERILIALDTPDRRRAMELARTLAGRIGGVKIGLELFTAAGPDAVIEARALGLPVFLDLKLHDIPATVSGAAAQAGRLGAAFLTVHALGGREMIRRAVEAAAEAAGAAGHGPPVVLAVTILTSHDDLGLGELGVAGPCRAAVSRLAGIAREAGAGGIVCSPLEVDEVRRVFPGATVVVPGIRPAGAARHDQARTATPRAALEVGADRIVIGRPVTAAADPAAAVEAIVREMT